jgi:hypothetical protein
MNWTASVVQGDTERYLGAFSDVSTIVINLHKDDDQNRDHLYEGMIPHKGHPGARKDDVAVRVQEITCSNKGARRRTAR